MRGTGTVLMAVKVQPSSESGAWNVASFTGASFSNSSTRLVDALLAEEGKHHLGSLSIRTRWPCAVVAVFLLMVFSFLVMVVRRSGGSLG